MPLKKPEDTEFEWVGDHLVHKPTGYEWWWAYPGTQSNDARRRAGTSGDLHTNGPDYELNELDEIAGRLLTEHRKE